MITYEEVGKQAGLNSYVLETYLRYMQARWIDIEEQLCLSGAAKEWAQRFKEGVEYETSDEKGRVILENIAW